MSSKPRPVSLENQLVRVLRSVLIRTGTLTDYSPEDPATILRAGRAFLSTPIPRPAKRGRAGTAPLLDNLPWDEGIVGPIPEIDSTIPF